MLNFKPLKLLVILKNYVHFAFEIWNLSLNFRLLILFLDVRDVIKLA